jgi:hypothetical protein
MVLSLTCQQKYAGLRGTEMTPDQKAVFESIVGLVHREAMKIAELPKERRAAALLIVQRSMAAELGIADPELIDVCNEGIATVLQQIEASGSPNGGHA